MNCNYNLALKLAQDKNYYNQYVKIVNLLKNLSSNVNEVQDFHPDKIYYIDYLSQDTDNIVGATIESASNLGLDVKSFNEMEQYMKINIGDLVSHKSTNFFGKVIEMYWNGSIIVYVVENNGTTVKLAVEEIEPIKSKNLSIIFEK